MAITVAQLRTFLAVRSEGSIKGAAEQLVVTRPSVSGAISALEREVGAKLVERYGRGVRLTAAGAALVPFASRALGLLEEGRRAALDAADPERLELSIAAVNTAGEYIVPPVIRAFRLRHPRADIRLEVSNRAGVFRRVELRRADVGIGGSPPESGELEGTPFLDNELVVVAAPDHDLAARRGLSFAELEGATWLLRENGSGTRIFVRNLLAEKGIQPPTMTIGSNGAIKQSVRAGLGVSLLPRQAVALELAMGLLKEIDLKEELPLRRWYALYPGGGPGRPVVETFLRFLADAATREAIAESLAIPVAGADASSRSR
ncbi:MAG: LysR family transcriptional regulator [Rubrobacteraceae bacterium]